MTRMEVGRLAGEYGFDRSDKSWLARSAGKAGNASELNLIDLTFRSGQLVAYEESRYDPRTKKMQSRTVDLCERPVR